MTGYTKLFHSILASTIWREDDKTRIVWITLLAMAGRTGVVEGSIPGLADMARVSIPECEAALEKLGAPDRYSRTKDHDGRRIQAVDGGWLILNHAKYRDKMSQDDRREYMRKYMAEYRSGKQGVNNRKQKLAVLGQSEAEAEAEESLDIVRGGVGERPVLTLSPEPAPAGAGPRREGFAEAEAIYQAYPRKVGKPAALKAIVKAMREWTSDALLAQTKAYADAVLRWPPGDEQFVPHPATWFNQGRYFDDPKTWERIQAPVNGAVPAWKVRQDQEYQIAVLKDKVRWMQDGPARAKLVAEIQELKRKVGA